MSKTRIVNKKTTLDLSMDRILQLRHNEMDISSFWVSICQEYSDITW